MKMPPVRWLLLFMACWGMAPLSAQEQILDFSSDIQVHTDGAMTVQETIRVQAEGNQIKRGIYRDFPTDYQDRLGNRYRVGFQLLGVERDGQSEAHHQERHGNGVRIYIGQAEHFLPSGIYSYTIRYRTDRQLGFFDDHDELYWNVTGNGWEFPIQRASARVLLPTTIPADQVRAEGYTGPMGSRDQAYVSRIDAEGTALFETTAALGQQEGLTIVVSWPKGYVQAPSEQQRLHWFLADNRDAFVAGLGLLLLLAYYGYSWLKVGRDPEAGVIIPIYTPPEGLSPAAMRFIRRMGYDDKALSAAVVNMAVAGHLRIEEEDNGTFELVRQSSGQQLLAAGELAAANALFAAGDRLRMKQENHERFSSARDSHKKSLQRDYEKRYFLTNSLYLVPGIVISLLLLVLTVLSLPGGDQQAVGGFLTLWLTFWSMGVFFLLKTAATAWSSVAHTRWGWLSALFTSLFAIPFLAGEVAGLVALWLEGSPTLVLLIVVLLLINYLFYQWMKAPTLLGRRLLDRIEGFKHYLEIAEQDELELSHPPEKTPELFERYLPYAIALDVENRWAEKFQGVLRHAAAEGHYTQPAWYHGHHWDSNHLGRFASGMGAGMSSAISSAATAPGSSSGGGGGGSSGGGGGGGGGGGW